MERGEYRGYSGTVWGTVNDGGSVVMTSKCRGTKGIGQADRSRGGRSREPETLARTQPKFDPYSLIYGSSSIDRGGRYLMPNLLLISNVLVPDYMLDCNACRLWD